MVMVGVDDLLFQSRIRAAAQASGTPVTFVRHHDAFIAAIHDRQPSLVILDLDCEAIHPIAIIQQIRADPALVAIPLVAFAAHVHADRLQAARDAGCDRVLARSRFVAALPELISSVRGPSQA